jgi:hypothetical protein
MLTQHGHASHLNHALQQAGMLTDVICCALALVKTGQQPAHMRAAVAGIMQGYFLKLLGGYRSHVYADGTGPGSAAAAAAAAANSSAGPLMSPRSTRSPRTTGSHSQQGRPGSTPNSARSEGGSGRHTPSSSMGQDDALRGQGFWFDHSGMVAVHR